MMIHRENWTYSEEDGRIYIATKREWLELWKMAGNCYQHKVAGIMIDIQHIYSPELQN